MSKSTSTLLDGNHVYPPFYACYLLRSKATPNSNRTYVGARAGPRSQTTGRVYARSSSPAPPAQRRTHTRRVEDIAIQALGKSWCVLQTTDNQEMQMIVYG